MSWPLDYFEIGDQLGRPTLACLFSKLSVLSVPIGFSRILTRNLRKIDVRIDVRIAGDRCTKRNIYESLGEVQRVFRSRYRYGSACVAAERVAGGGYCRRLFYLMDGGSIGAWSFLW